MRELTYLVATSLDGLIAAPDGSHAAFPTTGDHIDMLVRDYPDTLPAPALEAFGVQAHGDRFDTVLMGWDTYAVGWSQGLASPYPHLEQVVFTRRHLDVDVPASVRRVASDPVAEVRRLKQQPGQGIWLCGGGVLAGVLAEEIDRLVVKVNPLVLGEGRRVLAGGRPSALELVDSTPFASGVVVLEYRRAG